MSSMGKGCLCRLYYGYLRLLEKTVRLEVEMPDMWSREMPDRGAVIGFWHEDSFLMNLLLRRLAKGRDIAVIVTSDGRGDYIEALIGRCNGRAIRVPDGCKSRNFLRDLIEEAKCPGKTLAAAMDGPLGPRQVPKTLGFYLAEKGRKNFIEVQVQYSRAVSLNWRWDHYHIPLPFTDIRISLKDCGITGDRNAAGRRMNQGGT